MARVEELARRQTPWQRELEKLASAMPVFVALQPLREDGAEQGPPVVNEPEVVVDEINKFVRKTRLAQTRFDATQLRLQARQRLLREQRTKKPRVEQVIVHLRGDPSPERLERMETSLRRNFATLGRPVHAIVKIDGKRAAEFNLVPRRVVALPARTARPAAPRAVRRVRSYRKQARSEDPHEPAVARLGARQ